MIPKTMKAIRGSYSQMPTSNDPAPSTPEASQSQTFLVKEPHYSEHYKDYYGGKAKGIDNQGGTNSNFLFR